MEGSDLGNRKRGAKSKVRSSALAASARLAFVIMAIGDDGTPLRKRADSVYKHVICAALKEAKYEALRADQIDQPGQITTQIVEHLVQDPLVIADLTGGNPNVFYELALRHVTRKPYIMLAKRGEALPFDMLQTRTIFFDETNLDDVNDCKNQIVASIKGFEAPDNPVENPITLVLDRISLTTEVRKTEQYLRDILTQLLSMSSKLTPSIAGTLSSLSTWELTGFESRLDSLQQKIRQINSAFSLASPTMLYSTGLTSLELRIEGLQTKLIEIESLTARASEAVSKLESKLDRVRDKSNEINPF